MGFIRTMLRKLEVSSLIATVRNPGRGERGGKGVSLNCAIFPETLASAEALPGICLGVNDVSSPASLAT